ncbi:uncharacterized protein PHACADRAFT_250926 [Phanerochaete carnosa HHB-10118-sp]|uniref:Glycoside hydrolase family 16 protein n=1 Tax=Phanerochaete carnosa (strain HHB-10118-sp) TaxID=650164 RepID=K5XAU8_PHACS|nr:uncharacterized protein PHACADRAFT_250926 [Phanerochaete carnosa HHB-10118-sp]EKM60062.1 hypothetical protein PHACADRAFT_250926 [Phanerochaete carnosa HHB-10118-sp]
MKVVAVVCAALACASSVHAQYFSEGWKPGQPAVSPTQDGAAPAFTPGAASPGTTGSGGFDLSKLFTSGPVGSLLAKAGVNLSAAMNTSVDLWDMRIPLIHDDNYDELIVHEPLTPEEELNRTWFLVISTTAGGQHQGGISKLVDNQFDVAYNETIIADDLPDVRWGRIDYMNVTYLTTKWNVWRGPWLVVARDRGQTLRFYKGNSVRLNSTIIRNFLKEELWQHQEPWNSAFAPGGSREIVMHYWAFAQRTVYDYTVRIPKFLLMIIAGGLGSVVMRLLHRPPSEQPKPATKPTAKSRPAAVPGAPAPAATSTTPASSPKKTPSKKKGGRK